jgi:hypothetical protein
MTVRINKPALNLREELTKAQGVVRYEQRQFWMEGGLIDNGTFDTGTTNFTLSSNWSISGGTANVINTNGGNLYVVDRSFEVGKRYILMTDVLVCTGTLDVKYNNANIFRYLSGESGSNSGIFTAVDNGQIRIYASGDANGSSIETIKAFEVDENDDVIHSVPLGFKPVHVYEDGLLQREGDNHDYTVVKTGGAYAIKPTVQPTATTETCIIAEREL